MSARIALTVVCTLILLSGEASAGVEAYRAAAQELEGLIDYYPLDGDARDIVDGGNGFNNGPLAGAPAFGEGLEGEGKGLVFDGTNQILTVLRSIQDDFTIIAWIRTNVPGAGGDYSQFFEGSGLIYADVGGVANDFGTAITGSLFGFGIGNPDATAHSLNPVTQGEWVQVVAVREIDADAAVSHVRIYINGALEADEIHPNVLPLDAAGFISIGGNGIDRRYYTGELDEVALFGLALDGDTIEELYDTVSQGVAKYRNAVLSVPGLIDYYDYEDSYDDIFDGGNGFNNPQIAVDPTVPTWEPGVGGEFEAARFDGIDDFFTVNRSIQDSFSIVAWILVEIPQIGTDTSQFFQGSGLIYSDVGGVANDFGVAITGSTFAFGIGNPDTTIHSTTNVVTSDWIHVAAVREVDPDTSTCELRVYVNGVREAAQAHSNVMPLDANALITIGANTIDRRFFSGVLDEVALYGVALDDDAIASLYSAHVGLTPCFTMDPAEGPAPLTVQFDASCSTAVTGGIASYQWTFGDGESATGQKVSHTFTSIGTFAVKLTVVSTEGFSASISGMVTTRFRSGDVSPWVSEDVGAPETPGGARREDSCFVIYARGSDIGVRSDQFHFVHQGLPGDGTLTARFTGFETTSTGAKAGLMMRATTDAGSAFAGLFLRYAGTNQLSFLRRTAAGELSRTTNLGAVSLPAWLKLERKGNEIIAYKSEDGSAWEEVARDAIDAAGEIRAGLAATGRDLGTGGAVLATACDVQLTGGPVQGELFHRGDANGDGSINITDGIFILNFLFLGGDAPRCLEAANPNDDASINITDGIYVLNFLFLGGDAPAPPGPTDSPCGPDPAESPSNLGCEAYDPC